MTFPCPKRGAHGVSGGFECRGLLLRLAIQQPGEAFESGEIHARRKRRSDRDCRDPEQPLADTHLIPWVAPRCERRLQEGPERRGPLLGIETRSSDPPCAA